MMAAFCSSLPKYVLPNRAVQPHHALAQLPQILVFPNIVPKDDERTLLMHWVKFHCEALFAASNSIVLRTPGSAYSFG